MYINYIVVTGWLYAQNKQISISTNKQVCEKCKKQVVILV